MQEEAVLLDGALELSQCRFIEAERAHLALEGRVRVAVWLHGRSALSAGAKLGCMALWDIAGSSRAQQVRGVIAVAWAKGETHGLTTHISTREALCSTGRTLPPSSYLQPVHTTRHQPTLF